MSEIAKAYVQIVPTTKGMAESLKSAMGGETASAGEHAGKDIGSSLVSTLKKVVVAAGIGSFIKSSLDAGGALQQSFGGLDTIYGEASDAAKQYAYEAAKAGISANSYAEQAVSFGASLKQAFDGDVKGAAEAANIAIMDMADNSAKMGTDVSSIQNAYQGFAKQNYTMLDNLKLGYGGTKTEMERLLSDAEKLTGIKYDINNLGDVYGAIHVIQQELGLTGVAAAEAEGTFTGSFGSMKASLDNFLANLSTGENIQEPLNMLVESAANFLTNNMIPMLMNIVKAVPDAVVTLIDTLGPTINDTFVKYVEELVPGTEGIFNDIRDTISSAFVTIQGIVSSAWELIKVIWDTYGDTIMSFITTWWEVMKTIFQSALNIVQGIINVALGLLTGDWTKAWEGIKAIFDGIWNIIKAILQQTLNVISTAINIALTTISAIWNTVWTALSNKVSEIWNAIKATISNLLSGIKENITKVKEVITEKIGEAVDFIKELPKQALTWGRDLIQNFINGIKAKISALKETISDIADSVADFIGFSEPEKGPLSNFHTYAPDMMNLFAQGIKDNEDVITKQLSKSFNFEPTIRANAKAVDGISGGVSVVQNIYSQAKTASELMREARWEQERAVLMGV